MTPQRTDGQLGTRRVLDAEAEMGFGVTSVHPVDRDHPKALSAGGIGPEGGQGSNRGDDPAGAGRGRAAGRGAEGAVRRHAGGKARQRRHAGGRARQRQRAGGKARQRQRAGGGPGSGSGRRHAKGRTLAGPASASPETTAR
ncbi:hypothetical protein GCM10027067_27090 [Pseudactinotalea suaedae]